jgi:hypothetical protein
MRLALADDVDDNDVWSATVTEFIEGPACCAATLAVLTRYFTTVLDGLPEDWRAEMTTALAELLDTSQRGA